jgi:DNA adenine methylase
MSWIGGKKALRDTILPMFPLYYERYIEVFGGGGWILFAKPPGNDFEVYNDFNGLLVNLYRCVRDKPQGADGSACNMSELPRGLRAGQGHALARDSPASDVQKAAMVLPADPIQLRQFPQTSFGSQPHDMRSNFPLIEQAHRRLAKVVVENKDFEKLIRQYDRPVSFFYCDPPYFDTEELLQKCRRGRFCGKRSHVSLRDALLSDSTASFCCPTTTDAFIRKPL